MRLTHSEQTIIKKYFKNIFNKGQLYLFGSRVDNHKKGGDIDLYIISNEDDLSAEMLFNKKLKFLSKLQLALGEQKIDLIISKDKNRPIEKEALKNGIEL
jgi:predicted nucleotidyltransferase